MPNPDFDEICNILWISKMTQVLGHKVRKKLQVSYRIKIKMRNVSKILNGIGFLLFLQSKSAFKFFMS